MVKKHGPDIGKAEAVAVATILKIVLASCLMAESDSKPILVDGPNTFSSHLALIYLSARSCSLLETSLRRLNITLLIINMKFKFYFSALVVASTVSAIAIDKTVPVSSSLSPRVADLISTATGSSGDISKRGNYVETGNIKMWISRRNGSFQIRLLGGLRIVSGMLDLLYDNGLAFSKAFFADFIAKNPDLVYMKYRDSPMYALFKLGNSNDWGMVGMQFEVRNHEHLNKSQIVLTCRNRSQTSLAKLTSMWSKNTSPNTFTTTTI
jgi:hypothetical protein